MRGRGLGGSGGVVHCDFIFHQREQEDSRRERSTWLCFPCCLRLTLWQMTCFQRKLAEFRWDLRTWMKVRLSPPPFFFLVHTPAYCTSQTEWLPVIRMDHCACLWLFFNHVKEAVIVWQATYKHTEKTALFPFSNDNPGNLLESLCFLCI